MTKKKRSAALVKRATKPKPALRPAKMPESRTADKPQIPTVLTTEHLNESIALGEFGLVEVTFTAQEEAVLSEPVAFADMRVLPTGQVYLPHIVYTRLLNRAFGRTGWALRPCSKPLLNENTVVVPYLLMVHQKPVAFALGEQEYFGNNKQQSYGDALESTVASGLRRCCKHLGIALELWDKPFNEMYLDEHCVGVWNEQGKGGKGGMEWRRKIDPPFWWEKKQQRKPQEPSSRRRDETPRTAAPARPETPSSAQHWNASDPITKAQRDRLAELARTAGRTDAEMRAYITDLGYDNSTQITRDAYDAICTRVSGRGPLVREPGEDDGD